MFTKHDALSVAKLCKLPKEEQDYLLLLIAQGKETTANKKEIRDALLAQKTLITHYQPVVAEIALKYTEYQILPLGKLIKLGNKGLNKSIKIWIDTKGSGKRRYRFIIYAMWFIRMEIHKSLKLPDPAEL